jgi:small subunit ribosomal protein S20
LARSTQSEKVHRSDEVKRTRNRSRVRALRTAVGKVTTAATPEEKLEAAREAQSLADKAGRRRVIHPNKASRIKSRLAKTANPKS